MTAETKRSWGWLAQAFGLRGEGDLRAVRGRKVRAPAGEDGDLPRWTISTPRDGWVSVHARTKSKARGAAKRAMRLRRIPAGSRIEKI